MNGPIIKATGLRKIYDTGKVRVHALRGVNLSIQRGETTLLNCLSGLDDVNSPTLLTPWASCLALTAVLA